jgi:hypothetical protein
MPGPYFPAASTANGQCFAMPDVCNVPSPAGPIPTPFPNMGMCATATETALTVLIENMPAIVLGSKIPMSSGDEAGVAGGIVSGLVVGQITVVQGSSKVFAKGKPMAFLTAKTVHNGTPPNAPLGNIVAPSQAKVIIAP